MKMAIITKTYRNDEAIVRDLCRSIDEFVDPAIHHHIVVSKRERKLFADLASPRRSITVAEDYLPKGFFQLPMPSRLPFIKRNLKEWWVAPGKPRVSGWVLQQIIKMSAPAITDADIPVFLDSDVTLLRPLTIAPFVLDGKVRFCHKPGLGADQAAQREWSHVTGRLLGIEPRDYYGADYVGQIISWRRDTLLRLQQRIAEASGEAWQVAVARQALFSEYLTYGVFIDEVEKDRADHARTAESLTLNSWNYQLSKPGEEARFIDDLKPHHVGVLLQSIENISTTTRERIIKGLKQRVALQDSAPAGAQQD